jgi:hypothetical protein
MIWFEGVKVKHKKLGIGTVGVAYSKDTMLDTISVLEFGYAAHHK